jgi:hypothetical protein
VVLAGKLFADGTLHETRQGRQHVDGRIDLPVVELTIDENLALRDVAGEIRNRVCDIFSKLIVSGMKLTPR